MKHRLIFLLSITWMVIFAAAPVSAAQEDRDGLLQFTAGGHVLGFDKDSMVMATGSHALRVEFMNATGAGPKAEGGDDQGAASGAKTAMPLSTVTYPELWKGVTLAYNQSGGNVKSTYTVVPGTSVADIRLRYNVPVKLMPDGSLRLEYETGYMSESPPVSWQVVNGRKKPVDVAFLSHSDQEIGFSAPDYDSSLELVIDPSVSWNTFMGSESGVDECSGIAVDGSGNVYVTGNSEGTWGSPVNAHAGGSDAFAAKLNPSGVRQWNTFMGSAVYDYSVGIAVDVCM